MEMLGGGGPMVAGKLAQKYGVGNNTISGMKKGKKIRAFAAGQESSKTFI